MFGGPPAAEREASSIAQLESRMSERFSKLEASLAQVLTCVQYGSEQSQWKQRASFLYA